MRLQITLRTALTGTIVLLLACGQSAAKGPWQYGQKILPADNVPAVTPETRTLPAEQARRVLEDDWLYQAMGEPLLPRARREIVWARELAARLAGGGPETRATVDLSRELAELAALEKRLAELEAKPPRPPAARAPEGPPVWIWHEAKSAEDAPVETRYFRRTFELPSGAAKGELRIAVDDACEVYVNAARVGANSTWQRAAAVDLSPHLVQGRNVLAVRAVNGAAPVVKNPAGLIARLEVTLADGRQVVAVSDASWRSEKVERPGWQTREFDDSAWPHASVSGAYGGGPWGRIAGLDRAEIAQDPRAAYVNEHPDVMEAYFAVRRVKRAVQLANSLLDFQRLLIVDQPIPRRAEQSDHQSVHRMGICATPGGRLLVLDGLHPGAAVRQLAPRRPGTFWRPDVSFDARSILFCYKAHDEKAFHLYRMEVDGQSQPTQLTFGDYDDIDPIHLPDGRILFTTTRGNSYVRCGPFIYSYILARCDADGGNLYLISLNSEPDFVPSLLADGRVVYSRWEYTDKALWRVQSLWTTNPDGTNVSAFWGNQSVWPDHVSQPMQVPGSRRVMFCGVGHHDWWSGSVGLIDPDKGRDFPHGLTKATADRPWPECGNGPVDPPESPRYHPAGAFTGYTAPWPLSERDFLVCARGAGSRFRLYLMDVDGNRELLYEGVHNVLQAMPIRPRQAPPVLVDRVAWPGTGEARKPPQDGELYSPDVYEGTALPRGSVRSLRIVQQDAKTYSTWAKTYRNSGPAVSIVQEEAVKRFLGTVPVEADGSVRFHLPAGRAVFFQLLDERGRCIQTMRSFSGVMPGESRGCVGCHEMHSTTPPRSRGLAFARGPRAIEPPPWGDQSISYERFVQPVLDRYCGSCHQGEGKARAKLDLTLRPGHGPFKEPYVTLVGPAGWGSPAKPGPGYGLAGAIPVEQMGMNNPVSIGTIAPLTYLSGKSKLIDIASNPKYKMDAESLQRLIAWVDACCPYFGEEEIRALGDPDFPGIEKLPIRPRVATAPKIQRP